MINVKVYTKDGCHLCDNVISALHKLRLQQSFEVSTKDITTEPRLFERYKNIIPVVEIDGKIRLGGSALSNPNTLESTLRRALAAAQEASTVGKLQ